jgi:hypothetical protein
MYHCSMSFSPEERQRLPGATAPRLQHVQPLDDHDVRVSYVLDLAGRDVIPQVRIDRRLHFGHA